MPPFETIHSELIFDGRVINLRLDTLQVDDGQMVTKEIVEHRGGVVIAALDPQGQVLMVRQYRHAVDQRLLELPAGTIELGEEPIKTAVRELQEETGFYPEEISSIGGFYTAPGFCNEYLHLFIARRLRPQPMRADVDEDIELETIWLDQIPGLIAAGEIKDAKTIAGLHMLQMTGELT